MGAGFEDSLLSRLLSPWHDWGRGRNFSWGAWSSFNALRRIAIPPNGTSLPGTGENTMATLFPNLVGAQQWRGQVHCGEAPRFAKG